MNISIDLIPLLILFSIITVSRINRIDTINNYLSKENSTVIRGFSALCVMFLHVSRYYRGGVVLPLFFNLGRSAVGIFFFLSAYGLMKQHISNSNYYKAFLVNRFKKLFLPYIIVTLMYWVFYNIFGESIGIKDVLINILKGEPIVNYSWYVLEIIIIYLFFYIFMKSFNNKYKHILIGEVILCSVLTILFINVGFEVQWYISMHMFVIGTLWAIYEEKILSFITKNYTFCLLVSLMMLICTVIYRNNYNIIFIQEPVLMMIVILFFMRYSLYNPILKYLGKISMEIYLLQGLSIRLVRVFIDSDLKLVCILLTFFVALVLSSILNKLFKYISELIK